MENLNELKIGDLITRDAIKTIVRVGLNMEVLIKTYDLKYRDDLDAQDESVINTGSDDESNVYEVVAPFSQNLDGIIENGRLKVDAELEVSDIQIGAVEIKDATTDTRMIIETDGSINTNIQNESLDVKPVTKGGAKYISTTSATTPESGYVFSELQVIQDCVISAVSTETGSAITGTITGEIIPAGIVLQGRFTSVTLTSGKVLAYQSV